jgi:hypothetical protein
MQPSKLPNGMAVPSGTKVLGHVVSASGPVERNTAVYDDGARVSSLTVCFDSLELAHETQPINTFVPPLADPFETNDTESPQPSDMD